ncbi:hypothetical protein LX32DRAFT_171031 [Colletotrichum zoysiae]|uniref:Uncharacterized protein n=1 Tax=Colletotrichum zoysiae TaxID=1216348 RepID=A0AAD9H7F8_9PEZI|nr:hypothetical protein LX32DRAFT_171031 [Colletotrichum zoysiae]
MADLCTCAAIRGTALDYLEVSLCIIADVPRYLGPMQTRVRVKRSRRVGFAKPTSYSKKNSSEVRFVFQRVDWLATCCPTFATTIMPLRSIYLIIECRINLQVRRTTIPRDRYAQVPSKFVRVRRRVY